MEKDYKSNLDRLLELIRNKSELNDNDIKWIHENINKKDMVSMEELILLNAVQQQILIKRSKRNAGNSSSSPISST